MRLADEQKAKRRAVLPLPDRDSFGINYSATSGSCSGATPRSSTLMTAAGTKLNAAPSGADTCGAPTGCSFASSSTVSPGA